MRSARPRHGSSPKGPLHAAPTPHYPTQSSSAPPSPRRAPRPGRWHRAPPTSAPTLFLHRRPSSQYDEHHRLQSIQIPGLLTHTHQYNPAHGRLETTTDGTHTVTTTYQPDSDLIHTHEFDKNTQTRLTTTRTFDAANRLRTISSATPATTAAAFTYQYNAASHRTHATMEDGTTWHYGYNPRGEITGAQRVLPNGNPFPGQQFGFQFDGLGNRLETTTNGRTATYEPNSLNQYEERTVPPFRDVRGKAHPAATVSIGGEKTDRTLDGQYHQAVPIDNTTGPAHAEISILGVRNHAGPEGEDVTDTQTGSLFLPENPEAFTHDFDGNLTSDGRWTYEWNAENQLAAMETRPDLPATLERQRLEFTYDHAGRRIRKEVFQWDGTEFTPSSDTWFLYHGWKLIAEYSTLDLQTFDLRRSYTWGHDLTGTFECAGTVGGLLATTTYGSEAATWFMAYDGNGNIASAVNAETGATEARFHYGPFGETLTAEGPAADQLSHRYSTKYTDTESGLLYYGFRYYEPETGRWLSRDPVEERGGINLYGFVGNAPLINIDYLGLETLTPKWLIGSVDENYTFIQDNNDGIGARNRSGRTRFSAYSTLSSVSGCVITIEVGINLKGGVDTILSSYNRTEGYEAVSDEEASQYLDTFNKGVDQRWNNIFRVKVGRMMYQRVFGGNYTTHQAPEKYCDCELKIKLVHEQQGPRVGVFKSPYGLSEQWSWNVTHPRYSAGQVAAHEIGHFLGNAEDYGKSTNLRMQGNTRPYGPGGGTPEPDSVMGVNIGKAKERHFWRIQQLLSERLDGAELIPIQSE